MVMRRLRAWFSDEVTRAVRAEVSEARTGIVDDVTSTVTVSVDSTLGERLDAVAEQQRAERAAAEIVLHQREQALRERDDRLAQSIELLAGAIRALDVRLAADADDRQRWLDTIDWLVHEVIVAMPQATDVPSTVLGGTIDLTGVPTAPTDPPAIDAAPQPLLLGDHVDLSGRDDLVGLAVEVRSRFSDRWTGGFEIAEVVRDADPKIAPRFRLARCSDHHPLPVVFDAASIRPRSTMQRFAVDALDLAE